MEIRKRLVKYHQALNGDATMINSAFSEYCEVCGERPGKINSRYSFENHRSTSDCGDWICWSCEEELEIEQSSDDSWPGCLWRE